MPPFVYLIGCTRFLASKESMRPGRLLRDQAGMGCSMDRFGSGPATSKCSRKNHFTRHEPNQDAFLKLCSFTTRASLRSFPRAQRQL